MEWVRGDFLMSEVTLNRFFALHVVALPLVLVMLVFVHIVALHHVGSNNPDGIEIKKNKDANGIPRRRHSVSSLLHHRSRSAGDRHVPVLLLHRGFLCAGDGRLLHRKAELRGREPLKTPDHIAPGWYYTPFYAMLRAATFPLFGVPAKFWGFVVMAGAIVLPACCPGSIAARSSRFATKACCRRSCWRCFVVSFFVLGYLGTIARPPVAPRLLRSVTAIYFAYFVLMPWYTRVEKDQTGAGPGDAMH